MPLSHPLDSQHGPQLHPPHHVRDFTPNLATLAHRLSHPGLPPPPSVSFPRTSSSSFATWALACGTGPPHRHAIAPHLGIHARTCQNYLPLQFPRTIACRGGLEAARFAGACVCVCVCKRLYMATAVHLFLLAGGQELICLSCPTKLWQVSGSTA